MHGTRVRELFFLIFFNFQFVITQLSKNRVSKHGHFPNYFGKLDKMLDFFFKKKGQKPVFSLENYHFSFLFTIKWQQYSNISEAVIPIFFSMNLSHKSIIMI